MAEPQPFNPKPTQPMQPSPVGPDAFRDSSAQATAASQGVTQVATNAAQKATTFGAKAADAAEGVATRHHERGMLDSRLEEMAADRQSRESIASEKNRTAQSIENQRQEGENTRMAVTQAAMTRRQQEYLQAQQGLQTSSQ